MKKNKVELSFNKNISCIITTKLKELNQPSHNVVIKDILSQHESFERLKTVKNFRFNDSILIEAINTLSEIKELPESEHFSDRTFMNIKHGSTSSSGFNIFTVIYILNYISEQINQKYKTTVISLIDLNSITVPLDPKTKL